MPRELSALLCSIVYAIATLAFVCIAVKGIIDRKTLTIPYYRREMAWGIVFAFGMSAFLAYASTTAFSVWIGASR